MKEIRTTYVGQSHGCLGDLAYELRVRYLSFQHREGWTPAINAYRCRTNVVICVELAGVAKESMEILVEPGRLLIRGLRRAPEPEECDGPPRQILALEIDHGPFEREIALNFDLEPDQVRAEQRNGLLWIYLPLRSEA